MSLISIICLSLALAVDVFGLSFAYGLIIKNSRIRLMLRLSLVCGMFQALMPVIGYFLTSMVSSYIESWSNIIVCLVFCGLGINIIKESLTNKEEGELKEKSLSFQTTIMIGIATSIDALVSGTMLYLTKTSLVLSATIIGLGSFLIGIVGFNLNCCLKKIPEKYLQILAGIILIALGIKNLIY